MCLEQVLPFPTLLSLGSPTSCGQLESPLTKQTGSLLPPPVWSQAFTVDIGPEAQPGASWASLLHFLISTQGQPQLITLSRMCLCVLAEAPGRCRAILGRWWKLCGWQAKGISFLSRALATSLAPDSLQPHQECSRD